MLHFNQLTDPGAPMDTTGRPHTFTMSTTSSAMRIDVHTFERLVSEVNMTLLLALL